MSLPNPLLERLHAGDDPDGALAARATEEDRRRLEALAASDDAILRRYPTSGVRERLRARRRAWAAVGAAAVGAAAWLVVAVGEPPSSERVKGDPVLTVLDGEGRRLRSGATVSPGDTVQLVFDPAGAPYAAVVSVDGRGHVTRHLPWPGSDTRAPSWAAPLPRSFRLDDAPSFEVFYAVTSTEPIDLDALRRAAASGGPDRDLAVGAQSTRIVLRKSD